MTSHQDTNQNSTATRRAARLAAAPLQPHFVLLSLSASNMALRDSACACAAFATAATGCRLQKARLSKREVCSWYLPPRQQFAGAVRGLRMRVDVGEGVSAPVIPSAQAFSPKLWLLGMHAGRDCSVSGQEGGSLAPSCGNVRLLPILSRCGGQQEGGCLRWRDTRCF